MQTTKRVRFDDVPMGASFYDAGGEWCIRTNTKEARDKWCAPGFCIEFEADETVDLIINN